MKVRTADEERRSAVVWLVFGVIFLVAMFGMWWLVEETNLRRMAAAIRRSRTGESAMRASGRHARIGTSPAVHGARC